MPRPPWRPAAFPRWPAARHAPSIAAACWVLLALGSLLTAAQASDDLFNDGVLHEIRLQINARDWLALKANYLDNTYYPCDLRWNGTVVHNVGVRSRGSGSRSGTKPGLRIDVNRYASEQRFLGLKSFVLDNLVQDPSMLREALSMLVFQRMGQPAPREAFAQLWVNNQFVGIYTVVESVDKDFLDRALGEDDGYLFEYAWRFPYDFHDLGETLEAYAEIFEPKTHDTESAAVIYGPIAELVRTVNESPDALFESQVSSSLNLDDFVRYLAVENALAENDGFLGNWGMNNFYLYRSSDGTRSRLLAWDKDSALLAPDFPIDHNLDTNVLARRTLAIPRLRSLYVTTLEEIANALSAPVEDVPEGAQPSTWFEREVDRLRSVIAMAAAADRLKPYSDEEHRAAVEQVQAFASERPRFLKCELARLSDPEAAPGSCSPDPLVDSSPAGGR